jgi:hypothetical protein
MWVWGENNRKVKSWGTIPDSQHFEGIGVCWNSEMGTSKVDKQSLTHIDLHKTKQQVG